jgi:hypothetical protein
MKTRDYVISSLSVSPRGSQRPCGFTATYRYYAMTEGVYQSSSIGQVNFVCGCGDASACARSAVWRELTGRPVAVAA